MKTTIRIAPLDAALVLRGNGTFEVWLPHVHTDPPPNAVATGYTNATATKSAALTMTTRRFRRTWASSAK